MDLSYGLAFPIQEVKASGDAWVVSGYAAAFSNQDHGGDVILPGAFDETLASGRKVKFLYAHKQDAVLGVPLELKADDHGLFGRFKISRTRLGEEVYTLLKDGALDSFSIGYIPLETEYDGDARLLKTIDLLEVSQVAVPMNERALVTGVKQSTLGESGTVGETVSRTADEASRLLASLDAFVTRHKGIAAVRAADGRHPSQAFFERLKTVRAAVGELLALETTPSETGAEPAAKDAASGTDTRGEPPPDSVSGRLALARERLSARGLLTQE